MDFRELTHRAPDGVHLESIREDGLGIEAFLSGAMEAQAASSSFRKSSRDGFFGIHCKHA
jgi:hypothetical protein